MFVVCYLVAALMAAILLMALGIAEGLSAGAIILRVAAMYVTTQALIIVGVVLGAKGFVPRVYRSSRGQLEHFVKGMPRQRS